jgi:hypothetical protein
MATKERKKPKKTNRTNRVGIKALEREVQALELRKAGVSYRVIAARMEMSQGGAFKAVMRAIDRIRAESSEKAEQLREIELMRLDSLQAGIWVDAVNGDPKAVNTLLRLMKRRAELLGLDAPSPKDAGHSAEKIKAKIIITLPDNGMIIDRD